ncbi:MAG TPA: hypothetical protein VLL25_10830 [Acidimicrobiales bacterium]|nr:hypothetical protein [Acidimicrobiales bacterium]
MAAIVTWLPSTAQYCAERLQQVIDLGISRIYIGTRGVGVDPAESNRDRVAGEVLPILRAARQSSPIVRVGR